MQDLEPGAEIGDHAAVRLALEEGIVGVAEGALDRILRERLLGDLRQILREVGQTAIYVTHDQEEAFSLADRIVLMGSDSAGAGRVEQIGTPIEIYQTPATEFVARFLGFENILDAVNVESVLRTDAENFLVSGIPWGKTRILIRPDGADLTGDELLGVIVEKTFRGSTQLAVLKVNDTTLVFEFPAATALPAVGENLVFSIKEDAIQVFS
jgi:thiamine transport system ATP-binding protein